jgi:hypothetical protein
MELFWIIDIPIIQVTQSRPGLNSDFQRIISLCVRLTDGLVMDDLAKGKWPREFIALIDVLGTERVVFDNCDYQASAAGGDDPSNWLTPREWLRHSRGE